MDRLGDSCLDDDPLKTIDERRLVASNTVDPENDMLIRQLIRALLANEEFRAFIRELLLGLLRERDVQETIAKGLVEEN